MQRFAKPIVFVDVETTGGTPNNSRILEVGMVRLEPTGEITRFQQLINPAEPIPPSITRLTGIRPSDVADKPRFEEVAQEIHDFMNGAVFAAHVVQFDLGFMLAEFNKAGIHYRPLKFCTVRLSRILYAHEPKHSVDAIMQRLNLKPRTKHRALDDAEVLLKFYSQATRELGPRRVMSVLKFLLNRSALKRRAVPTISVNG